MKKVFAFVFCQVPFFLLLTILASIQKQAVAQNHVIRGKVTETFSKQPLPFVHITVNDTMHRLTDIDGNFSIPFNGIVKKMSFSHYMHRQAIIATPGDSIYVGLNKYELFSFSEASDSRSSDIVQKIEGYKSFNDYRNNTYSYKTYSKFTLSSDKNENANKLLVKFSKLLPFRTNTLEEDQHLLIIESVTEKKYINDLHQNELITGSRSSNVTVPSIFIETSKLHSFSIYDNHIRISGKDYLSPLIKKGTDHYAFTLIDELPMNGNKIYIIKFNPLPGKKIDLLRGIMYVNSKNFAVQNIVAEPAEDQEKNVKFYESFKLYNGQDWFPERITTVVISGKPSSEIKFIGTVRTFIEEVKLPDRELKKNQFDEVILEYNRDSEKKTDDFWIRHRREPLTHRDSATFNYYSNWDKQGVIQKMLTFGEHLMYGYMPIKKINVDMNRIMNFNQVESVRLGFGAHTNERFSEKIILGGYFGYGFRDKRIKYGADFAQRIYSKKQVWYKLNFSHDLTEAGGTHFSFDRYQYSSEVIRKFRLRILDLTTELDNSIVSHPLKYLDVSLGINQSRSITTYTYAFKDHTSHSYNFSEIRAGFRFAFGEQFIKFLSNKKSLGTKYPVVYFQYTKGLHDVFGDFDYLKYDFKLEQSIRLLNLGVSTFQFIGGVTYGNAPYQKLYNMRGSLKNPSFVIHNSFETMRYNEFLSDHYFALFFSHNLGKIKINHPNIQPSILFVHNMGIGGLSNPEYYQYLPFTFKTMEKGYIESGAVADNVLVLNLAGMRTGFGGGVFLRYGPYASLKASQNLVLKFSVNFGI